jgi:WD40 repeat protein
VGRRGDKQIGQAMSGPLRKEPDHAGKSPPVAPCGHDDAAATAAFSPYGKRIVTASADETARLWDAESGKQIDHAIASHESCNDDGWNASRWKMIAASAFEINPIP